jgi:hypothetical protein
MYLSFVKSFLIRGKSWHEKKIFKNCVGLFWISMWKILGIVAVEVDVLSVEKNVLGTILIWVPLNIISTVRC